MEDGEGANYGDCADEGHCWARGDCPVFSGVELLEVKELRDVEVHDFPFRSGGWGAQSLSMRYCGA